MEDYSIKPQFNLHYWLWQLRQIAKKLGVFGLLGLAIALGCGLFYASKITPINDQILQHNESIQQVKPNNTEQKNLSIPINNVPQQITSDDITKFYARFPNGASLPKWLSLINETAIKHGLLLNRGDYKLTQIKSTQIKSNPGQLSRYEIMLPVTGQYSQIRQFIAQVLYQMPALALSEMQIKRENTLRPTVEARLVFVLMLQGDHWK
jgi:Tfp pilus assembly protein PilO